jgi:hypothetical protein
MTRKLLVFDPAARSSLVRGLIAASKAAPSTTTTPPQTVTREQTEIRVDELIDRTNDALAKMSTNNPHRWLILQLGTALAEVCKRLDDATAQPRSGRDMLRG